MAHWPLVLPEFYVPKGYYSLLPGWWLYGGFLMCASVPCAIAVILLCVFGSLSLDAHRRRERERDVCLLPPWYICVMSCDVYPPWSLSMCIASSSSTAEYLISGKASGFCHPLYLRGVPVARCMYRGCPHPLAFLLIRYSGLLNGKASFKQRLMSARRSCSMASLLSCEGHELC